MQTAIRKISTSGKYSKVINFSRKLLKSLGGSNRVNDQVW